MGYPEVRQILASPAPSPDDLMEALEFLSTDRGYLLCLLGRNIIPDDGTSENRKVLIELVKSRLRNFCAQVS